MYQILIVDTEFTKYAHFKNELEEQLPIEVSQINETDKVLSLIQILPDINFILVNGDSIPTDQISKIENLLVKDSYSIPLLIIEGHFESQRKETKILNFKINSLDFLPFLKNQLIVLKEEENPKLKTPYIGIDIEFITEHFNVPLPVDLYLRIKKGINEFQFLKRLRSGDLFKKEEVLNFRKHNLTHFYIINSEYKKLIEFCISQSLSIPIDSNKKTINKNYDFHLTKEALEMIGIDEITCELVNKNVKIMENAIDKNEPLALYINFLKSNPNSFSYVHSSLISLVLSKVVTQFDWDSHVIKEKVCFIAFFHDITLSNDHFSRIQSEEELNEEVEIDFEFQSDSKVKVKKYSESDRSLILNHALKASIQIEQIPNLPLGVSQVIKEHHGSKSGIGFLENQSSTLQPLSMLFIVVEEFVFLFLALEKPTTDLLKKTLDQLALKYSKGTYKKTVDALRKFTGVN